MKAVNYCYEIWSDYTQNGTIEHLSKDERKKKKATKKASGDTFKDKVKNAVNKLGQIGVLSPFKKLMINALKDKKISVNESMDLSEISSLFYDNVVRKDKVKKNYEVSNLLLTAEVLGGIVSGVLAFFKGLKKKKDSGETLTPTENKLLTGAEKIDSAADDVSKDYTEESIGEMVMKYWYVPVGLLVLYFLMKK